MLKRILLSGVLGGVVLLLWTMVTNGLFGFTARLEMKRIPNERAVYAVLKDNIVEPGAYLANPEPMPDGPFPPGQPVFGIRYGGMGHEAAGRLFFIEPALIFLAAMLAAGLLAMTSARILSRYSRKVLFVVLVGLLLAVYGDLSKFGIGGYPANAALLLAANHAVAWTLAGLVMAGSMRAPREPA
jgi:hypothetical protein